MKLDIKRGKVKFFYFYLITFIFFLLMLFVHTNTLVVESDNMDEDVFTLLQLGMKEKNPDGKKQTTKITTVETSTEDNKNNSSNIKRKLLSENSHENSYAIKDLRTFKTENNKWDFKLIDRELNDIFQMFLYHNKKHITRHSTRAIVHLFINNFESCDTNKNNVLSLEEFSECIKKNQYFSIFNLDDKRQPDFMIKLIGENKKWTNITDTSSVAQRIFDLLNENGNSSLNFYNFMMLRLISFAWRKCGNYGFFIDEVNFECAIEIVGKTKTLNRNSAKKLYNLGLEISNFNSVRNMDLLTFVQIGLLTNLYGKMNTKEDGDLSRAEFNLALDSSLLPIRYDKEIISNFYKNIMDKSNSKNGIDLYSFIFFDIFLRMFKLERKDRDPKCIEYGDFVNILNDFQFPKKIVKEMYGIPYFNITKESYQMFLQAKVSKYYKEQDFLMKKMRFSENFRKSSIKKTIGGDQKEVTVTTTTTTETASSDSKKDNTQMPNFASLEEKLKWIKDQSKAYASNSFYYILDPKQYETFNFTFTATTLFHLMDFPKNNCVEYEEFLYFIQITYLYKKFDKNKHSKLGADFLSRKFKSFSGYPKLYSRIYQRSDNFKLIPKDTPVNLFYTYAMLRVDDIAANYKKSDYYGELVSELDLNYILERINIREFPFGLIDHCIKGFESNSDYVKSPLYDWNCAISKAVDIICRHLEAVSNYKIVKKHNIKLANTEFSSIPNSKKIKDK